jgi:tRNA pseudouridine32 synthase/23S rRNA pseudouridine746 synthase
MVKNGAKRFAFSTTVRQDDETAACDFLATRTCLSKTKIKDAMNKGAVWLKRNGRMKRLRKASAPLAAGDHIELHYDERLLSISPPEAYLISDRKHYSVWFKPAGLMAQGTMFGDHCSLMRRAELFFRNARPVFLVHRLDREAEGIMLLAHSSGAAAKLSSLFQKNEIMKRYRATVLGNPAEKGKEGSIALPLDGKEALTEYEVRSYDQAANTSVVNVLIRTGRLHQIRRHFDMMGFPVMGDPKYGKGNKNKEGMKLTAVSLRFTCPFSHREVEFTV